MNKCPCGSGKLFDQCCGSLLRGVGRLVLGFRRKVSEELRHHFNLETKSPKDFQSPKPEKASEDNKVIIKPINSKAAHSNAEAL